jgi:2-phosphosulfolactate phosphatase
VNESGPVVQIRNSPEAATRYGRGWAVVGVDVFRATTVVCTVGALGRCCHVARDLGEALLLADALPNALLSGEQNGNVPKGFDVDNSPVAHINRTDWDRPLVVLSSSGTPLLRKATSAEIVCAASLRNLSAQIRHLLTLGLDVALVAAGTRGERRIEDDIVCARIGAALIAGGYVTDRPSREIIDQLEDVRVDMCASGSSARFLRATGRQLDIDFVLSHVDDLDIVFEVKGTSVLPQQVPAQRVV